MNIPESIQRFAEAPEKFVVDPPAPARRWVKPAYTLLLSPTPTQSTVTGVLTTEAELDGLIAEVRATVREAGYTRTCWVTGPTSRPHGLAQMLRDRGFVPATAEPFEPTMTAMALLKPPPSPPPGVETRQAANMDDFVAGLRIAIAAFGMGEEDAAGWLSAAPNLWPQQDGVNRFFHLAFLDGQPVGFSFSTIGPGALLLGGSGILPAARGRGAYLGLVAARWADAVKLGRPALVVQAGAMSRPILERCGFEAICELDQFDDPTVSRDAP